MDSIVGLLSGAPQAGQQAGSASQGYYSNALGQILNSINGPGGQNFVSAQNAALIPQFQQQDTALTDQLAAQGVTGSGAAKKDFTDLATGQSYDLARADAPLYSEGLGAYDSTAGAGAGAASSAYGSAYQGAINSFMQALSDAGAAAGGGIPGGGGGGGGGGGDANPYAIPGTAPGEVGSGT